MSRAVRIAAIGHCSALGLTVHDAAAAAADHSAHAAGTRTVLGQDWPWFAMALASDDREHRARDAVGRVGAALAAALPSAEWATTPLFVASSSLQMGVLEAHTRHCGRVELPADAAAFAHQVADWLGLSATPWTFSTTCTSALAALDAAATLIRSGAIERALVLGIELANDTTVAGFAGLGLLARSPADAGLALGEAVAGVLLCAAPTAAPALAPTATPTAGATPGWFIRACRLGIDGHSPTGPAPDGAAIAAVIRAALADAGLAPAAIDVLKPHGGGLDATAAAEARALAAVFGPTLPAQIGFKPRLGHTLGASGLAELGLLLATLDRAPSTAQHALLNVIGFGGSMGALVLSRAPTTADHADHAAPAGTATERARITLAVDSAELSRRARSALGAPLRRAGPLVELCLAGIDACLDACTNACTAASPAAAAPARSSAVLFASRSGPRVAFERVLADLCVGNEDPMPFDFLATQAALAALPLRQRLPDLQAACYLPLSGASALQWTRMSTLAHAWLASGRHDRVLIGMVEPGGDEHCCEWRCYA